LKAAKRRKSRCACLGFAWAGLPSRSLRRFAKGCFRYASPRERRLEATPVVPFRWWHNDLACPTSITPHFDAKGQFRKLSNARSAARGRGAVGAITCVVAKRGAATLPLHHRAPFAL
jgi:hypothetical protein